MYNILGCVVFNQLFSTYKWVKNFQEGKKGILLKFEVLTIILTGAYS